MADYILPMLLALVAIVSLRKKENIYDRLLVGAAEGLRLLLSIAPALVVLLSSVYMLRASGALTAVEQTLSPLCARVGIPPETLPLILVRPLSGSAALAIGADLIKTYGPDSIVGRTTAIMLGSTETTFYTVSVYFGAAGIRKTRYAVPASLIADLTGFLTASLGARLFFSQ